MRSFLVAAFTMFCGAAVAQVGWTFPDVNVAPGSTTTYEISLEDATITTYIGGSCTIQMPTGFTITNPKVVAARTVDHAFSAAFNDPVYKCSLNSSSNAFLTGTSGPIVTFDIVCDATVTPGEYTASVTSQNITYKPSTLKKYKPADLTFKITVKNAVDITLANASGYNSYCCDKDLDVSGVTDAKFYVVSSITASEATLTQVTTGIPAGEGFLIEGSGTANISVPVAATTPTATGSKLVGVTTATSIEAGNYILKSDGSSFVPCTAGTLPANKAYLKKDDVPATAKEFLMIVEDAVVTGINEVQAENSVNGPIYNLNGARVSNPQKGVYIMNGRKVIVK